MKVGILTLHFSRNFGAVLQCASLSRALKRLGHEVVVIDYDQLHGPKERLVFRNCLKLIYKFVVKVLLGRAMDDMFKRSRESYFALTEPCSGIEDLARVAERLDAIVVGSDQVWNLSYGFVDEAYFLPSRISFDGARISYAACCGHPGQDQERLEELDVPKGLAGFDRLLVRNQVTKEWVKTLTGRDSDVVCDPTLLIDDDLSEGAVCDIEGGYILVSVIGEDIKGGLVAALNEIRKHHGDLRVLKVATNPWKFTMDDFPGEVYREGGPREWAWLIKNASFVLTDSFHATIFSIKNEVPFVSYWIEEKRKYRLLELAESLGLEGSVVSSVQDGINKGSWIACYDWKRIKELLVGLRTRSLRKLQLALGVGEREDKIAVRFGESGHG